MARLTNLLLLALTLLAAANLIFMIWESQQREKSPLASKAAEPFSMEFQSQGRHKRRRQAKQQETFIGNNGGREGSPRLIVVDKKSAEVNEDKVEDSRKQTDITETTQELNAKLQPPDKQKQEQRKGKLKVLDLNEGKLNQLKMKGKAKGNDVPDESKIQQAKPKEKEQQKGSGPKGKDQTQGKNQETKGQKQGTKTDDQNNAASKQRKAEQRTPELKTNKTTDAKREKKTQPKGKADKLNHNAALHNQSHKIAGLSCKAYGGPDDKFAQEEMVYWQDVPSDAEFVSPWKVPGETKYLTFEPDSGGWNNLRMSLETMVALAHAMGRTLVMPPEQNIYLLGKQEKQQKNTFSFNSFFHFDSMEKEHSGFDMISMEEFLSRMSGNLIDEKGEVKLPPGNRTNWEGIKFQERGPLKEYLRSVIPTPPWKGEQCFLVFSEKKKDQIEIQKMMDDINSKETPQKRMLQLTGNPTPVDGPVYQRLREIMSNRKQMCFYSKEWQDKPVLHFMGSGDYRMLVHFYAFLFFQDWKQDLWTKRFLRDHVRYVDEIQCAAARIIQAVREKAKAKGHNSFDTMHVRRGDFQYKDTRIEADDILKNSADVLQPGGTLFIATDERNRTFFEPLMKEYDVYFLGDFLHLIEDVNTNLYGMLDQLIASKGRVFIGAYFSTFTSFINRMRGYHASTKKLEGHDKGVIPSYYYIPLSRKHILQQYSPLKPALWMQDFPVVWRDIDKGIGELES